VLFQLGSLGRVVVRPSGTEPKLKAYMEIKARPDEAVPLSQHRAVAAAQLGAVRDDLAMLLQP
jgi:phosphomannomutase